MLVGTLQGKEGLGIPKRKILKQLVIKKSWYLCSRLTEINPTCCFEKYATKRRT